MFSSHVENKLAAYLHQELNERTTRKVRSHLRNCESCQAQLQQLIQADDAAQKRPLFTADEDLWTKIAQQLPQQPVERPVRNRRRSFGHTRLPKFSFATAFVILVVMGWWWLRNDVRVTDEDWPHWRGKNQDGKAIQSAGLPFDSGIKLRLAWKKSLGSGYSSVSVAQGRAVTMYSDSSSDFVIALDAHNGDVLWRHKIDATYKGHDGSHDGPMSTPLLLGETVYAVGPRGQLVALDAKTGNKVWSTHLVKDHDAAEPFYGFATSPILDDGVLIVETGGTRSTVAGFDSKNGKRLWSAGNDSVNYHSPVRFRFAGQTQLVCASNNYLYGLEPRKGQVLWSYRHNGRGETINPVVIGQKQIFLRKSWEKTLLLELRREKRTYVAEKVWDKTSLKSSYDTPIYHEGHLYGFSGRQLKCVDAASGDVVWKSSSPGDGFTILVDGYLIITTKQGTLHAVKAHSHEYQELAGLQLFEGQAWTPPSFADGRIYARSLSEIACIEIVTGEQAGPAQEDSDWMDLNLALAN